MKLFYNYKCGVMAKSNQLLPFVFLLLFCSCLKTDELNLAIKSTQPKDIADGLFISNPSTERIDADSLSGVYQWVKQSDKFWGIRSLLVFRNNQLISEAYFKDENDITTTHLLWSGTKQVMALLMGIAIDSGYVSLNKTVGDYLPEIVLNHPDKARITIENLLKMRSGIGFKNDGFSGNTDKLLRQIPESSVDYILNIPTISEQGLLFNYNDGDPQILSAILQKVTGKKTDEWAKEVLFNKIGFKNYNWVRYKDGITFGAFGIETTARELSKISMLVSRKGSWNGQQIVNPNWIEKILVPQAQTENGLLKFGYYWWIDPTRNIQFIWGHGGQFSFIIPDKSMIVTITALPNTQGRYQILPHEALELVDKIVQCVQ